MQRTITYLIIILHVILFMQTGAGMSYPERQDHWVRSVIEKMTIEEKIGQLFMLRAYSRGDKYEEKLILQYIEKYHIGGLCFFQGSVSEQVRLVNKYQQKSKIPLFIGIDAEWGLGQRFPNQAIAFPKQMMLGAIQDNRLIYDMGKEIALQLRMTGVNINFAPAVDINNNPLNPVIWDRSFGEDRHNVTSKGYMYIKALEDHGIMACAKHFPGHGDTDTDSHLDLPLIPHKTDRLDEVEIFPFRRLASQAVGGIMVAHLHLPELDPRPDRPATLSHTVVTDLLRDQIGFRGLIFTDAMDMKAITKYYAPGIAEAEAFLAGNDIILLPNDIKKAIETILQYIEDGRISEDRLNASVYRILRSKYQLGLHITPQHAPEKAIPYITRNEAYALKARLIENAITLVSDKDDVIPIRKLHDTRTATLSVNVAVSSPFQHRVDDFSDARHYTAYASAISADPQSMYQTLLQFDRVLIGIHTSGKAANFRNEVTPELKEMLMKIASKKEVIILLFGSPYLLSALDDLPNILLCYDNDAMTQDLAVQALYGVNAISGALPVSSGQYFSTDNKMYRGALGRLGFALPEQVGLNSDTLRLIEDIIHEMIKINATPGGQVLIAKDGKIVFERNFGKMSSTGSPVSSGTIYDVASVTKILSTTLSMMSLSERKKIDIFKPIKRYINGIDTTNKANLMIADILAHHAPLQSWIPFYESTLPDKNHSAIYNQEYYRYELTDGYTIPVASRMFMRTDYRDTMWQKIWSSKLRDADTYLYSDIGYYILQRCIESASGKKLNEYAAAQFYKPLGLRSTGYLPLGQYPASIIAPTEADTYWRKQIIQGHVHDMGAAMLGGVGGHAGLFSTAREMGIMMQMLLNKGSYGGTRYFKPQTVDMFTRRYVKSTRRGLGFDMKETDPRKTLNMSALAPESTFGHLGFTGTAAFADPENRIIFIFTSNRTYTGKNLINSKEFRPRIQSVIYRAIKDNQKVAT